jgi:hypothetical protein
MVPVLRPVVNKDARASAIACPIYGHYRGAADAGGTAVLAESVEDDPMQSSVERRSADIRDQSQFISSAGSPTASRLPR